MVKPYTVWKTGDKGIELAEGDYYAKEQSSGRWFFVDSAVYEFTITSKDTSNMNFEDQPFNPEIRTSATDADTGNHYMS